MIKKLTLLVGVGAGYVLGAKAGQERYQQIKTKVNELRGTPQVTQATEALHSVASDLADKAKDTVTDQVGKVTGSSAPATPPPVSTVDLTGSTAREGAAPFRPVS